MAFRQQQRPQSSRQLSYHEPPADIGAASSPQRKRAHDESEEWVLFSPGAPSTTALTHTTSTDRTPRTAGLSRLSDFGSLDTAARSQDDDHITHHGTEDGEDLDSLDDGLHAFHEPSEYAGPSSGVQQTGDTLLPTHDGLGTFQPDANVAEHMWQFERQAPRRRHARRRSSVQRRLDALEETEELTQEQDRRQRIEQWRLEQSRALLEEIQRETRRRRRMSVASAARSRPDSAQHLAESAASHVAPSMSDGPSEASDQSIDGMSFWQRLTRRVIRDLMGIDEDTLSVIFGESLADGVTMESDEGPEARPSIDATLQAIEANAISDEGWQHRLLERVACELGILVHQLSEHPGAFSTYLNVQHVPDYAGLPATRPPTTPTAESTPFNPITLGNSAPLATSAHFAPTFPGQPSNTYSEASLWGIEEEPVSVDPLDSYHGPAPRPAPSPADHAEEIAREQEYWERELDVKMVFNFLLKKFSSRRSTVPVQPQRGSAAPSTSRDVEDPRASARRAAIIRQNHPLVSTSREPLPTSSRPKRRESATFKTYYHHQPSLRNQVLKSSSSVTSQSTKKSKRSGGSGRNYWDFGESVGSGSVIEGKA